MAQICIVFDLIKYVIVINLTIFRLKEKMTSSTISLVCANQNREKSLLIVQCIRPDWSSQWQSRYRAIPDKSILNHSSVLGYSSFILHHLSFIIHKFIIRYSSFFIHHSSFIIHHSSLIIHHSSFIIHHSLLNLLFKIP